MDPTLCSASGCSKQSLFGSDHCWNHTEDKNAYRQLIADNAKNEKSLKDANLDRVNLSDLDLSKADLTGANLSRASLTNTTLFDANLNKAELLGADLRGADLTGANLEEADLTRAELSNARLWHANLENATLIEASLNNSDLWNARLFNARFWRTDILRAFSISKESFAKKKSRYKTLYSINEKGALSAEEAYRSLKQYFLSHGKYNDASWASFMEKTMERKLLKQKHSPAYIPNLVMSLLCGYGEKPHRIVLSSLFVILFFALLYFLLNAVHFSSEAHYAMKPWDYIYYSIITFTTVGYGDFVPRSVTAFRLLAATEGFMGVFMGGLFIFTLARRYSAR